MREALNRWKAIQGRALFSDPVTDAPVIEDIGDGWKRTTQISRVSEEHTGWQGMWERLRHIVTGRPPRLRRVTYEHSFCWKPGNPSPGIVTRDGCLLRISVGFAEAGDADV